MLLMRWFVRVSGMVALERSVRIRNTRSSRPERRPYPLREISDCRPSVSSPKGESGGARARRSRQYEDFFNASGMATPDDLEEFRACQEGFMGRALEWNDMSRGATHWVEGPDEEADKIGLKPILSGVKTEDEGLYVAQHTYWLEQIRKAAEAEAKNA